MAIDLLSLKPHKVSRDLSGYITYIYGAPKCGKTTLAVRNIRKEQKQEQKYNKWKSKKIKSPFKILKYWLFPPSFYDRFFTNFDCILRKRFEFSVIVFNT